MSRTLVIVTLAACACDPTWRGGTGVGNPGSTQIVTAQARDGVIDAGHGRLTSLELTSCDGKVEAVTVDEALDLLGSGPLDLSGGRWCDLTANFEPPLTYSGTTVGGATFDLTLDVGQVSIPLADALKIDGTTLVTELGYRGWVNEADLGLPAAGTNVSVGPGDPLHDLFAARIAGGSALFDDRNDNGEVDDDERNDHELGEGPEHENEDHSGTNDD